MKKATAGVPTGAGRLQPGRPVSRPNSDYRVVRTDGSGGAAPVFAVHEVFYSDEGVPRAVGPMPLGALGDDAILWTLGRMREAMSKPVLNWADFKR